MRKLILLLAVAIAVAIGFSLSTLRAAVSRGAEAMAANVAGGVEGRVQVGDVSLSLWPLPVAEIGNIRVVAAKRRGEEPPPVLEIPRLRVHPKVFPLLVGSVIVDSVEAVDAVLHVRRETGKGEFVTFMPEDGVAKIVQLDFPISLTDATLHFSDASRAQPLSATIVDADLDITVRRGSQVVDLVGTARPLGDSSRSMIDLEFEAGVGATGGHRVDGSIDIRGAETDAVKALLPLFGALPLGASSDVKLTVSGLAGEQSTEAAPAVPLEITAVGGVDFTLMGRTEPMGFDAIFVLDDRSVQLKKGDLNWAGLSAQSGGWMAKRGGKLSGRLSLESVDVAQIMGDYGIDDRWHPELVIGGVIKLSGHEMEPLLNYQVSAESVSFTPYEGYEVEAGPTEFRGALWASNAVFSISALPKTLRIGGLELDAPGIGSRYFRDKFTATALGLSIWGGTSNSSIVYYPKEQKAVEAGGMLEDGNAAEFIADVFPELGLEITGVLEAIAQGGFNEDAPWSMGRLGFYFGEIGPIGIVNAVLTAVGRETGATGLIDPVLVGKYPRTLAPEMAGYDRIEMDYQTRDDGVELRSIELMLPHADIAAEGLIQPDRTFSGWGVLTLSSLLTSELSVRVPALAALVGSDDRLRLPVKLQGGPSGAAIVVGERFIDELRKSMRGGQVGPFVATEPQSELVMDMPSLRDQFNRW